MGSGHCTVLAYCNRWPSPPACHWSTVVLAQYWTARVSKVQLDRRSVGPLPFPIHLYYLSMVGRSPSSSYMVKSKIYDLLLLFYIYATKFTRREVHCCEYSQPEGADEALRREDLLQHGRCQGVCHWYHSAPSSSLSVSLSPLSELSTNSPTTITVQYSYTHHHFNF